MLTLRRKTDDTILCDRGDIMNMIELEIQLGDLIVQAQDIDMSIADIRVKLNKKELAVFDSIIERGDNHEH